jgi:hypothetical protein
LKPFTGLPWAFLCISFVSPAAVAQTNLQLWGNATVDWRKTDRATYSLDTEPKVLVAVPEGKPGWWSVDLIPAVQYAAKDWLDVTGEFDASYTRQTDNNNSLELTPRVGLLIHFSSRGIPAVVRERNVRSERPPKRRLVVRDWIRVEWRNFFYSDGSPSSSNWRLRNRLEFQFPLNRANTTMNGACYVQADWEWFIPIGDPSERFANRHRIRTGLGYRRDVRWQFEVLYLWSRSRDTTGEPFTTTSNAINFRVKRVF